VAGKGAGKQSGIEMERFKSHAIKNKNFSLVVHTLHIIAAKIISCVSWMENIILIKLFNAYYCNIIKKGALKLNTHFIQAVGCFYLCRDNSNKWSYNLIKI